MGDSVMMNIAQRVLNQRGHGDCDYAPQAVYLPEEGMAVCGCGKPFEVTAVEQSEQAERTALVVARDPIDSVLELIDATQVYTPADVEKHILDVLARLECGAKFERETVLGAYTTTQAFDRAYWRAFNASEATSEGKRKAEAMVLCEIEHMEMTQAAMLKEAAKATMHNLRAVLSGYQSVGRSVGAAYQGGGSLR